MVRVRLGFRLRANFMAKIFLSGSGLGFNVMHINDAGTFRSPSKRCRSMVESNLMA